MIFPARFDLGSLVGHHFTLVKNPVRTNDVRWREHGASSMEKAIFFWGLIAPVRIWPFIPAWKSGPAQESALRRAGHSGFFT